MRYTVIMVCMLCFSTFAIAQTPKEKGEDKVQAMKIAFITQKLALTSDEAQKFWPIYNQFEAENKALKAKYNLDADANKDGIVSEEEAEKALTKRVEFRQAQLDLSKKYNTEFKKAIPASKIVKLYEAQEEFKKVLLERLKKMQQNRKQGGPGRPGGTPPNHPDPDLGE